MKTKRIRIIESDRAFSNGDLEEIERALLKVPYSHLEALDTIERKANLGSIADSSPWGDGGQLRLSDEFYRLTEKERPFALLHEMGHNYFDYKDATEGDMFSLKFGPCSKEDVQGLLRVQWMQIGEWDLDPEKWSQIVEGFPENLAHGNIYTYTVMYKTQIWERANGFVQKTPRYLNRKAQDSPLDMEQNLIRQKRRWQMLMQHSPFIRIFLRGLEKTTRLSEPNTILSETSLRKSLKEG